MISEIANSLFLTYLASEYLISSPSPNPSHSRSKSRTIQHKADNNDEKNQNNDKSSYTLIGILSLLVGIANLLDHHYYLSVVWDTTTRIFTNLLPSSVPSYMFLIPAKLLLAASSYVLALYIDIHRDRSNDKEAKTKPPKMPFRSVFLPKVGWAFLKILPAYPFLAVLISFVFLFVVDIWEYVLHLPLEWLNNPIYYGTLYGPFAYTYVHVKRQVLRKTQSYYESHSVRNDAYVQKNVSEDAKENTTRHRGSSLTQKTDWV